MKTLKDVLAFENRRPNGTVALLGSWKGTSLRTPKLSASPLMVKTKSGEVYWYLTEYEDRPYKFVPPDKTNKMEQKEQLVLLVINAEDYSLWSETTPLIQGSVFRKEVSELLSQTTKYFMSKLMQQYWIKSLEEWSNIQTYVNQILKHVADLECNLLTSSPVFLSLTGQVDEVRYYMNMIKAYVSEEDHSSIQRVFSQLDKLEQILSKWGEGKDRYVFRLPPKATLERVEREELLKFFKSARYEH